MRKIFSHHSFFPQMSILNLLLTPHCCEFRLCICVKRQENKDLTCYSVRCNDFWTLPWHFVVVVIVQLGFFFGFLFLCLFVWGGCWCLFRGIFSFFFFFWEMLLLISLSKYVYQKKRASLLKKKLKITTFCILSLCLNGCLLSLFWVKYVLKFLNELSSACNISCGWLLIFLFLITHLSPDLINSCRHTSFLPYPTAF